jgi:hypothetical protein
MAKRWLTTLTRAVSHRCCRRCQYPARLSLVPVSPVGHPRIDPTSVAGRARRIQPGTALPEGNLSRREPTLGQMPTLASLTKLTSRASATRTASSQRITAYTDRGFLTSQNLPGSVTFAYGRLVDSGFNQCSMKR